MIQLPFIPDLLLVADSHIQDKVPICRTDDMLMAMIRKLRFLSHLKKQFADAEILHAGDLFDYWKASPWTWITAMKFVPPMIIVPGQHELPEHRLSQLNYSALWALKVARPTDFQLLGCANNSPFYRTQNGWSVYGCPFGTEPDRADEFAEWAGNTPRVLLWHRMTWMDKPFPTAPGNGNADATMAKYPQFHLIVTGDNHQAFILRRGNRLLVNCGSMLRLDADQMNHVPTVWAIRLNDDGELDCFGIPFPIETGVVTREHIDVITARDERLDRFVETIKSGEFSGLDFVENMKAWLDANPQEPDVVKLLWGFIPNQETK